MTLDERKKSIIQEIKARYNLQDPVTEQLNIIKVKTKTDIISRLKAQFSVNKPTDEDIEKILEDSLQANIGSRPIEIDKLMSELRENLREEYEDALYDSEEDS